MAQCRTFFISLLISGGVKCAHRAHPTHLIVIQKKHLFFLLVATHFINMFKVIQTKRFLLLFFFSINLPFTLHELCTKRQIDKLLYSFVVVEHLIFIFINPLNVLIPHV